MRITKYTSHSYMNIYPVVQNQSFIELISNTRSLIFIQKNILYRS